MGKIVQEILTDLYEIDPGLKEKEEELKKIIEKLLSSKPEVKMDKHFKEELKQRILKKIEERNPGVIPWIFKNKLKIALAAAAGIFSVVMVFSVFLPIIVSLDKNESKSLSHSPVYTGDKEIPVKDKDETATEKMKEEDSEPPPPTGLIDKTKGKKDIVTDNKKSKSTGQDESDVEPETVTERGRMEDEYIEPEEIVLSDLVCEYDAVGGGEDRISVREDKQVMESRDQRKSDEKNLTGDDDWNTEEYDRIYENGFCKATDYPESTFSIDVDTASYANVRRFLNNNQLPYKDAVRIEELINYFHYDYPGPPGEHPFAFYTESSECPWNPDNRLIHIGIQGKIIPAEQLPPSNLVFLLDVSGSMNDSNKLPLLKCAFSLLVDQLREQDRVAIVVYAGAAGLVLSPTPGDEKAVIKNALEQLSAGGSTAGGEGIRLAYKTAKQYYNEKGNNRVILATDGDFNIGVSSDAELVRLIEGKRDQGIFLTILGFGMGNYKDSKMEKLADKGNGNYAYIDTIKEANKVLVTELGSTLVAIAKDVKIQIEFNPVFVDSYRLIGYENRVLAKEDFDDDTKDAGELGAGHTVTALYEVVPAEGAAGKNTDSEKLKYQETSIKQDAYTSFELLTLKFRYKKPKGDTSILIEVPVIDEQIPLPSSSDNFRFSAAVAEWGLLLRDSKYKGKASYDQVLDLAQGAKGLDSEGYRADFIQLVQKSKIIAGVE
ncbi:MAG: VWA domain-containing protein [Spirochaetales bacterium]|nr:VWA domain-containing protein [Spirochaetales bacterium]